MLDSEVFIGELSSVDGETTGTVTSGEITTLGHEVRNNSVERRAFVSVSLLVVSSTERSKVFGTLGSVIFVELENYRLDKTKITYFEFHLSEVLSITGDVHPDNRVGSVSV